ncbi:MAG TPA: hypothetical protein VFU21_28680, partial [Kofleriaceae bacterium]|nr:hypothetical protein [Kofleriaceae bacterium]
MSVTGFDDLAREPGGHAWLPETVAWLWAALQPDLWRRAYNAGFAPPRTPAQLAELLDELGFAWRDEARALGGRLSPALLGEVARLAAAGPEETRALVYLRFLVALDRACDGLSLRAPRIAAHLEPMLARRDERGNLAPASQSVVLRRDAPNPSGGAALGYYLDNLAVLDAASLAGYRLQVNGLPDACRLATRPGGPRLRVAFVPVLRAADQVRFRPVQVGSDPRFTIDLAREHQEAVKSGARDLVAALERERVHIALLPETCVVGEVAEAFRAALVENYAAEAGEPHLRLLVVGVLAARRNEVWGLSGAGHRLLVQTKQQPWRLDVRQQERYGIVDALRAEAAPCDRDEDLQLEARRISAADDPGFGRLIVLICEDLQRCDPARRIAVDIGPTTVVAPVMDYALTAERWAAAAAAQLANEPGALVMV